MNNISQISIFEYREIENLGDVERLKIFFENIDDDKLCESLEKSRKNGRNDYPVRTMLNLIYAMKIFGHRSVESFIPKCQIPMGSTRLKNTRENIHKSEELER